MAGKQRKRRAPGTAIGSPELGIRGDRVRLARTKRGLSSYDVFARARIYPGNLSDIENGHKDVSALTARKLAVLFAVTSDYLLGLSDRMER